MSEEKATGKHTGEWQTILEWFIAHPGEYMTAVDISEEFGITRVQARNAIAHWTRHNKLIRSELQKGFYRLRGDHETREEFKVARVIPPAPKREVITFPVLQEFLLESTTNAVRGIINGVPRDRVQALDANTVI